MTSSSEVSTPRTPFAIFQTPGGGPPDYERIRTILNSIVPFGKVVGVDITEVGPERSVVEIPSHPELTNHMGTVHAGALFTVADFAGAAAVAGALAPRLGAVTGLVVGDARSTFRKPAAGHLRAIGLVDERVIRRVLAGESAERFELDVKALVYNDAEKLVAKFSFDYVCDLG